MDKNRNYDEILAGCAAMLKQVEYIKADAKRLRKEADAAEASLRDRIAKKDIDAIRTFADRLDAATDTGEERIRELVLGMKKEKDEAERLGGRSL